jgi:two-component system sensor histidine kinase VicK
VPSKFIGTFSLLELQISIDGTIFFIGTVSDEPMEDIDYLLNKIKKLEESAVRMEAQMEEFNDFIENAALPLHWVNGSGIIVWANRAELDLLGYEQEEYLNKHISAFHVDKGAIEDILGKLMNKVTLTNYPAKLKCKNGDVKYVLINSNVFWKDGKFVHTRCFTTDVSHLQNEHEEVDEKS